MHINDKNIKNWFSSYLSFFNYKIKIIINICNLFFIYLYNINKIQQKTIIAI